MEDKKEVKIAKVSLGFFPTAVTEEQLNEAREKSIRRIFGTTETLKYIKNPNKVGDFEGILRNKIEEHSQEGNQYFSQAEWEKAVICYTKALNLDPHMVELYEKVAEAFLQLCDFQSAVIHLRKAYLASAKKREIGFRLAFILHLQGQCLYEQSFYLDALQSFTRALELQPRNALYRMRSIACLAALKRYNDCLQMVNEEVARKRRSPDLLVLRARLYEYFGKVTFSFYNLQNALELDPDHTEAKKMLDNLEKEGQHWKDQATSKAAKGNLKTALLKINKAIEYNPLEASYFLFRGTMLRRLKDFNSAIDDFLKAVELSQGEEGLEIHLEAQTQVLLTYNDFAVHCYTKGYFEEAVLLLNKAIKGEQKEKGLYMNRGDCFLKLGELNFAMADYQQALELSPLDSALHKHVAWLYNEMGLQEFQERRFFQAESHFSHAIENNPSEFKYYLHRAKSRMFLQEMMGAKEDVVIALLLEPAKEEVHSLANTLFPGDPVHAILKSKMGQFAKALLDRRQEAFSAYKVCAKTSGTPGTSPPKHVYIQNDDVEKAEKEAMEESNTAADKQQSQKQRLYTRLSACQEKTHQVNKELKEVREKRVSLEPNAVRLDPSPQVPEKQSSKEPYHWRKFSQGIGHF